MMCANDTITFHPQAQAPPHTPDAPVPSPPWPATGSRLGAKRAGGWEPLRLLQAVGKRLGTTLPKEAGGQARRQAGSCLCGKCKVISMQRAEPTLCHARTWLLPNPTHKWSSTLPPPCIELLVHQGRGNGGNGAAPSSYRAASGTGKP